MRGLPLLFLLLLGCSEESTSPPPAAAEKVAEKADAIVIPPDMKITIFFGEKADTIGIHADGRGHIVTKDYETIEKQWTPEDYARVRRLCIEVIDGMEISNERIGGPGFEMMSINFGNGRAQVDFRVGIVKPEEFPAPVQDLLQAVLELQK